MYRIKVCIFIGLVSLCNLLHGQVKYSILDSLNNNYTISKIVLEKFPEYSTFEILDSIKGYDKIIDRKITELGIKPVLRIDTNYDGAIDLIFVHRVMVVDILVKDSNGNINFAPIYRNYGTTFIKPQLKHPNIYDYYFVEEKFTPRKVGYEHILHKKEICFYNGLLVEHNSKVRNRKIDKVEFEFTSCMGECPAFKMTILRNGQVTLVPTRGEYSYLPINKLSRATLSEDKVNELFDLINYINFSKLKSKYDCGATDNPTAYLIVHYNGKHKKIEDYGMRGNLGLFSVFNFVRNLLLTCEWSEKQ